LTDLNSNSNGEVDYYVGAVGAPPSRAAVNSQTYKAQTNQGSGAGLSGNGQYPRAQMSLKPPTDPKRDQTSQAANQASHSLH